MSQYQGPRRYHPLRAMHHTGRRRVWLILAGVLILIFIGASVYFVISKNQPEATENLTVEDPTVYEPSETPSPPPETPPTPVKKDVTIPPIENGLAPVISTIPTKEPVVFLGIDDGAFKDPSVVALMKQNNIKASLFLTYNVIANNSDFFKELIAQGSPVENHSITHAHMTSLNYAGQKQEICGQSDLMEQLYGRRPVFFRPPGGHYNADTQRAVADCGMKAIVMWIAKANGGSMQYQIGNSLRPGDIVLMHFRPEFQQDMNAFVNAMNAAGLHTELLNDWLP